MPINIPDDLPAREVLESEGIEVMRQRDAIRQDIRPMRILLLNLMPKKIETEIQLARVLSHTPLQVELSLLTTASYVPSNTSLQHMSAFYKTLAQVREQKFDGMIITGAPVERMVFEDVDYWPELCDVFDWAEEHVFRRFNICWGAQATLYHRFGIPKYDIGKKLSGVFEQEVLVPNHPLLLGFPDRYPCPVSRYTTMSQENIEAHPQLKVLAASPQTGPSIAVDQQTGDVFSFNHPEYDGDTLLQEYRRDVQAEPDAEVPANYFPGDDPEAKPANVWRPFGYLLFSNWMSGLYQDTPFDLNRIGAVTPSGGDRTTRDRTR
jgi:homoserine O-succinyltransferase